MARFGASSSFSAANTALCVGVSTTLPPAAGAPGFAGVDGFQGVGDEKEETGLGVKLLDAPACGGGGGADGGGGKSSEPCDDDLSLNASSLPDLQR